MRRRTLAAAATVTTAVAVALTTGHRSAAADDDAPTGGPVATIEKIMTSVGAGQIDDAVGQMEGLKTRADQKDAARAALLAIRDGQLGAWHGSDVSQVVRFTPRLQTADVIGYYDLQPILYRFECYQPVAGGAWSVLNLQVEGDLSKQVEVLREDASGVARGRGGRATR